MFDRSRVRWSMLLAGWVTAGWLVCAPVEAATLIADDFEYFPAGSGVHVLSPPVGTGKPLDRVWDNVVYWHSSDAIQIICDGTAASGNCFFAEHFLPGRQAATELRDRANREPGKWIAPSEELWVRHYVRLPKGWQWPASFGGIKLGRLRTAESCQSGRPCIETYWGPFHGDPTRIRWTYAYTPDGTNWCCQSNLLAGSLPGEFAVDRWYCLELHVRQNTRVDPADGLMEMYIDGKLVASNPSADTRGAGGPGTFAWTMVNISDNFVGAEGGAAATTTTPAIHFDAVVFSTTRSACTPAGQATP